MKYIFSTTETTHYRFPTHTNDLVMDRAEAQASEVFIVILEPGESPPLHVHQDAEQVFYILEGSGTLQIGPQAEVTAPVKVGDVVRIPSHTPHCIRCEGQETLIYLSVDCFIGGRPAVEPTWESHVRAMCAQNGWDFDQVTSAQVIKK